MNTIRLIEGDLFDEIDSIEDESVHAVVCDPPYGLGFMGNSWDQFDPDEYEAFSRRWGEAVFPKLKPGGYVLAFGGTRTHHNLFRGLEDAGYEIRDTITWHYGGGFPKGQDVGKSIDKWYSAEEEVEIREVCEWLRDVIEDSDRTYQEVADHIGVSRSLVHAHFAAAPRHEQPQLPSREQLGEILEFTDYDIDDAPDSIRDAYEELRDQKGEYTDHYDEREVVGEDTSGISEAWGDGEWDSDSITFEKTTATRDLSQKWEGWRGNLKPATEFISLARKPMDNDAMYRNCIEHEVGALNIDAGRIPTEEEIETGRGGRDADDTGIYGKHEGQDEKEYQDDGRYPTNLTLSDFAAERLDEQAGESSASKTTGDGGWSETKNTYNSSERGVGYERGYDDEGGKSRYFKRTPDPRRYYYCPKAQTDERTIDGAVENRHPTVKPKELIAYLIELVSRPDHVILDPFIGSGTTALACIDTGRTCIGIERNEEYMRTARERVNAYMEGDDSDD